MSSSKMPSHYGMMLPTTDPGTPDTPSTVTASPSITSSLAKASPSRSYCSNVTIVARGLSTSLSPSGCPPTSPLPPLPTNRGGRKPRPLTIMDPGNRQLLPAIRPSPPVGLGIGIANRPTGGMRRVVTESNVNEQNFRHQDYGEDLKVKKLSSRLGSEVISRTREGDADLVSASETPTSTRVKKWLTSPLTNHPEEVSETPTRAEAQQANVKSNVEEEEKEEDVDKEHERYIKNRIRLPSANPYKNNYEFTCALLKETYRDQSEAFARNAVSRSLTRTVSATPRSASLPVVRSTSQHFPGGRGSPSQVITPNNFFTPSRPSPTRTFTRPSRSSISASQPGDISALEQYPVQQPDGDVFVETDGAGAANTRDEKITYATYEGAVTSEIIVEKGRKLSTTKRITKAPAQITRGYLYFTKEERERIDELVRQRLGRTPCVHHANCQDCRDIEYALAENRAMNTSIPPEERQKIINNNRSLRNIKNELENLAEHGAISDAMYDTIMASLPAETPLNGARSSPVQASAPAPTNAFSNLKVNNEPPPPSYTSNGPAAPPSLPSRGNSKPEIARATALYRYAEPEDCCFEVGDEISVFEKMNADWWLGKNTRTGKEGVFPVNYVQVQVGHIPTTPYGNEKASPYPGSYEAPNQGYQPPAPGPSNPYNSSVPPMAVAEAPSDGAAKPPGKGGEMGKKFGKKLGNAAIFGAGATIGGNIVNSIF